MLPSELQILLYTNVGAAASSVWHLVCGDLIITIVYQRYHYLLSVHEQVTTADMNLCNVHTLFIHSTFKDAKRSVAFSRKLCAGTKGVKTDNEESPSEMEYGAA